jgi:uncharacterized protein (TIGR02246 family)
MKTAIASQQSPNSIGTPHPGICRRVSLTIILCVIGALPAAPATQARASQETAVRAVVDSYLAAREHRDAQALGDLFTADADQLTSSGEWRRGREAIVKGTLASSDRTGGTRTIAIQTVRFPTATTAVADGRYELTSANERRVMWTSFVMVQDGARWRISAIRNMLPAAAAK